MHHFSSRSYSYCHNNLYILCLCLSKCVFYMIVLIFFSCHRVPLTLSSLFLRYFNLRFFLFFSTLVFFFSTLVFFFFNLSFFVHDIFAYPQLNHNCHPIFSSFLFSHFLSIYLFLNSERDFHFFVCFSFGRVLARK